MTGCAIPTYSQSVRDKSASCVDTYIIQSTHAIFKFVFYFSLKSKLAVFLNYSNFHITPGHSSNTSEEGAHNPMNSSFICLRSKRSNLTHLAPIYFHHESSSD